MWFFELCVCVLSLASDDYQSKKTEFFTCDFRNSLSKLCAKATVFLLSQAFFRPLHTKICVVSLCVFTFALFVWVAFRLVWTCLQLKCFHCFGIKPRISMPSLFSYCARVAFFFFYRCHLFLLLSMWLPHLSLNFTFLDQVNKVVCNGAVPLTRLPLSVILTSYNGVSFSFTLVVFESSYTK